MPAATPLNEQVIEAVVDGPEGANRLFTCTGQAQRWTWLGPNGSSMETWTFLVGPELPRPQFHRATASAFVAGYAIYVADPTANGWHALSFESVEADWDDESGRAEMRVEISMQTGPGTHLTLSRIGFTATVLAELPGT